MIEAANKNYIIEAMGHENNTTTTGGIIIQHNDQTELAQIVSIGPQITENPIPVGTKVIVNWSGVVQVKVGSKKAFVIHADNILGIVTDES
jgi:co-chaperonin GroES (HSP10)